MAIDIVDSISVCWEKTPSCYVATRELSVCQEGPYRGPGHKHQRAPKGAEKPGCAARPPRFADAVVAQRAGPPARRSPAYAFCLRFSQMAPSPAASSPSVAGSGTMATL